MLIAYLSLLYPPPGSYHDAIPASSIVLAGDSAGATLCLSLVQTILRSQEEQSTIEFHGQKIPLVLPAGVAVLSIAGELTQALPSWKENADYDILRDFPPTAQPTFPSDNIWPSNPPRSDPYCDNSALCHPLVAPTIAMRWEGSPPMWVACGQERLADTSKIIAQTAAQQGVPILWEFYEAMPHTWAQIFRTWPQSVRCMESWARACQSMVESRNQVSNRGIIIDAWSMNRKDVNVMRLTSLTPAKALMLMEERRRDMKAFIGAQVKAAL